MHAPTHKDAFGDHKMRAALKTRALQTLREVRSSPAAHIPGLNAQRNFATLVAMGKTKISGTGKGYLGETMVHRITGAVGIVENVVEATAGWPPEITLKLPDGSIKKGKLSDFREPRDAERKKIQSPEP